MNTILPNLNMAGFPFNNPSFTLYETAWNVYWCSTVGRSPAIMLTTACFRVPPTIHWTSRAAD